MKRLLLAAALLLAAPAFSQTLTFTVESTTSGGTAVVPRLTWTTSPAGATCTASNGWTGTKAASGTELLPAISATRSYTLACVWPGIQTAIVNWTAPTTNTDGTAYTNPGGFRIQYGRTATALDTSAYLQDPAVRTWTSPTLATGAWFFGVRAFNALGLESEISNVATKMMTASSTQTRTLEVAIRFPNPPTGVTVE
ncbi:MAG TPA: hypothetical protein VM756_05170 [Burkholderiales bacterium]|nr:hypothetical protein [Burkholderiales bacterium]